MRSASSRLRRNWEFHSRKSQHRSRDFEHARRRFEIKYESDRFLLVDDYAHHPTEIRATLEDREVDRAQTRADDVSAASLFADEGVAARIRPRLSTTPSVWS